MERGVGLGHRREREREPHHAQRAIAVAHRHRHVEQRCGHRGAGADVPALPAGQRLAHLRPARVVLERGQLGEAPVRLPHHPPVRRDESDPGAGGARHPDGELLAGRSTRQQRRARLLVQHRGHAAQPGLEGLHREGLQRPVEVDPGGRDGNRHEADQREGELERDAPPDHPQQGAHQVVPAGSVSNR